MLADELTCMNQLPCKQPLVLTYTFTYYEQRKGERLMHKEISLVYRMQECQIMSI